MKLWNVRSLYRAGRLKTVENRMEKFKLDIEVRWIDGDS